MIKPCLLHDGKIVYIGASKNDCYIKLLRCQPQSIQWAERYEGYRVEEKEVNESDYSKKEWSQLTYNGIICSYVREGEY